ncbi:hypothetical protein GYH30_009950 [Glycine max]|nr:hypothetical protein GYH30_009950 [Glycine max]
MPGSLGHEEQDAQTFASWLKYCSYYLGTQYLKVVLMQSYPARALGRRLQVDWARDPREGPRVLMSLRVDFEPMG